MQYMYLSIIIIIDAIAVTILCNKKSSLCLIKCYAKRRMGRKGTAPLVSNLDTVWSLSGQLHAVAGLLLKSTIIKRPILHVSNLPVTTAPDIQVFPSEPTSRTPI